MGYPPEIATAHGAIIRAARHYVEQRGWGAAVGIPARCYDCLALLNSEDHTQTCDYDRLRQAVDELDRLNRARR